MGERCKVFIVEHEQDSAEMLKVAVEQEPGCEVRTALATPTTENLERIKDFGPDLVILDFRHGHVENWQLLDRLRADSATSGIPVISVSTAEQIVEQSLASYNVRQMLVKPFDLDDLSKAIREILRQPGLAVPAEAEREGRDALAQAADILVVHTRDIVARWLQQICTVEPFRTEIRLRPRQLINETPILLWGIVVALRTGKAEGLFEQHATLHAAVVGRAQLRKQEGVGLGPLIREYELLRDAVWQELMDEHPHGMWTDRDVFRIGQVVHRALDEVVAVAVDAYGQGRAERGV